LQQNYARTGYLPVEVGDLCGFQKIWDYWSPYDFCYFANPVIANELVYATFGVHLECFSIHDGTPVWSTTGIPAYGNILGGSVRTTPTVEDGFIYFSGGTFSSFVKADAFTGIPVWYRGGIGSPLGALEGTPGAMRFCPSVIVAGNVYFGGDGGHIYALDVITGLTSSWNTTPYGNGVWASPSTDGEHIYYGCSVGIGGGDGGVGVQGALYQYSLGLVLISPYLGNIGWDEGCSAGALYNAAENALYLQVAYTTPDIAYAATDGFTQKADAATMGPHADNSYYFCGIHQYSNPSINPELQYVFFGNRANRDDRFSGIWVKTWTFNTAWQDFTKGDMVMPSANSCDPYVFWGTQVHPNGTFNISDAQNGTRLATYNITGYGFGAALARYQVRADYMTYVAHTQLWSACATGGGRLTVYSQGADRPRLYIPEPEVLVDPPLDFVDPDGTERTVEDIFLNTGCIGLKYCLALSAHPSYPVKGFGVDQKRLARIDQQVDDIIEYSIDDFNFMDGWKEARMNRTPMREEIGDRPNVRSLESTASQVPPSWVTLVSPDEGICRVAGGYDATFAFTVSLMSRGQNLFWLLIATDDPDYNECDFEFLTCGRSLPVNDSVLVNAVKGFAFCDGWLDFGDGGDDWQYVNNAGWFDNGDPGVDALIVDGADDPFYQGSFIWGVDQNRMAWLEEGGHGYNHLFADTVCTLIENMYMDEMYDCAGGSTSIFGDYFESAIVDSIFDYATGQLDNALTVGLRMSYREWGAFGPEFNNFVLIAYDLVNRNPTPVDDVYFGCFADFDMPGDGAGYEQVQGYIDDNVAFQFNEVSGELAGFGCLPLAGSFVDGIKTTGAYNGYGISNPDEIYPPAELPLTIFASIDGCPQGDWCYHPSAAPGAPPDDRAVILTAAKKSFAGDEVLSGALMKYYFPGGASTGDLEAMMKFANKWAGYARGDLNDDDEITLNDIVVLLLYLNGGNPPCPWMHLGDVDADGDVDPDDLLYFYTFFFLNGPPPQSALVR
jgi:hypothetical protein